jgi:hypothetical protein
VRVVDECPVYYLDEISNELKSKFWKNFSASLISKMLIREGYTRKVVYPKAAQQRAQEKANFLSTLRHHLKTAEMAIFVDESNEDRKAAPRKYGWSKAGTPVDYRALFSMDIRYTFIGVADCFGFVQFACDVVLHKYKENDKHKQVDAERFTKFFREILVPVLSNYERKEPRSVVIMDNCKLYLDPEILKMIYSAEAIIIYSVPYCPDVFPIDFMFSQWKSYLK